MKNNHSMQPLSWFKKNPVQSVQRASFLGSGFYTRRLNQLRYPEERPLLLSLTMNVGDESNGLLIFHSATWFWCSPFFSSGRSWASSVGRSRSWWRRSWTSTEFWNPACNLQPARPSILICPPVHSFVMRLKADKATHSMYRDWKRPEALNQQIH